MVHYVCESKSEKNNAAFRIPHLIKFIIITQSLW